MDDGRKGSIIRVNGTPLIHYVCLLFYLELQAIQSNRFEIVRYFLESGADVSCTNSQKQTCIMIASKVGNLNIRRLTLSFEPSFPMFEAWGKTG